MRAAAGCWTRCAPRPGRRSVRCAVRLDMTRQATTKHFGVLKEANLMIAIRRGRKKLPNLNPVPIHETADRWIGKFKRGRLDAHAELKEKLEGETDA